MWSPRVKDSNIKRFLTNLKCSLDLIRFVRKNMFLPILLSVDTHDAVSEQIRNDE